MKQFIVILAIGLCFLVSTSDYIRAQNANWADAPRLHKYSTNEGLFSGHVISLHQDHKGFIWVGGYGGLYRFDGHEFYQFPNEPDDPYSIQAYSIPQVYEDTQLNLWVCSANNGLKLLNRETGQFTHFLSDPENPKSISSNGVMKTLEDSLGNFWVGTVKGLNLMDRKTGTFTPFTYQSPLTGEKERFHISSLGIGRDSIVWVGTIGKGLFAFNTKTKTFTPFHLPFQKENEKLKVPVRVEVTLEDEQGNLWVGTTTGLFRVNRENQEISTFRHQLGDPHSLNGTSVRDLKIDREGNLWIATQSGLSRYIPESDSFYSYFNNADDPDNPANDFIEDLLIDQQGDIWIGTGAGAVNRLRLNEGVLKLFPPHHKFPSGDELNQLSRFQLDDQGQLWISDLDGQLAIFDPNKNDLKTVNLDFPSTEHSFTKEIASLLIDHQGIIWVGTRGMGLFRYNPSNSQLIEFNDQFPAEWGLENVGIRGLLEDKQHQIWITLYNKGLVRYQPSTNHFTRFTPNKKDTISISSISLSGLLEAPDGKIWVAIINNGIDVFDPETETFQHFNHKQNSPNSLSNKNVKCLFRDTKDRIWVGTERGLNLYRPESNDFLRITKSEGLSNGNISTIVEDQQNKLWIGSDRGIFRYDPEMEVIHRFDHTNGPNHSIYHTDFGICHPTTGQLFFGTNGGLLTFYPDRFIDNPLVPNVIFSKATFYNTDYKEVPDERIWIDTEKKIELSYGVNIMEFELSLLNYHQVSKNKFAYQLVSSPQWSTATTTSPWLEMGTENKLRFTNLPVGQHTLNVKGASANGLWSDQITTLSITIAPPWWWSRLALMSYGLGIFGLILLWQRFENNQRNLRQQTQIAEARAEEEQRYSTKIAMQAKSLEDSIGRLQVKNKEILIAQNQLVQQEKMASLGQLTAGIAHEIKNPLNFVNNFAEGSLDMMDELMEKLSKKNFTTPNSQLALIQDFVEELRQNSIDIRENGRRADQIIHSMMDHARESNNEKQVIDLNKLIVANISLAHHGYRALDVSFSAEFEENLDPLVGKRNVYPQALGRVLLNLLNNACYAVDKKHKSAPSEYAPLISISSKVKDETIEIRIRDNGVGIPDDVKDKIFDPFFSTKKTGRGNTGLGLSISYDIIVKQHGGDLTVLTKLGEFTEFLLVLPISD